MKLSDLAKRMIRAILFIVIVCILGSIIYHRSLDFLPFLFGAIIGSAFSIFKVFLLDRAVDKALTMEKYKALKYVFFQSILRLLISGIALLIGALVPLISLWGVVAGIVAFPLATYSEKFRTNKKG